MWLSGAGRTSCDVCERVYSEANRDTPCDTCRPELLPGNAPFVTLYSYVSDQWIMGVSGAVGLNMQAIALAMDDFDIDRDERVLFSTKVRIIANTVLDALKEDAKQKQLVAGKRVNIG